MFIKEFLIDLAHYSVETLNVDMAAIQDPSTSMLAVVEHCYLVVYSEHPKFHEFLNSNFPSSLLFPLIPDSGLVYLKRKIETKIIRTKRLRRKKEQKDYVKKLFEKN